jgi:hypothetical protein
VLAAWRRLPGGYAWSQTVDRTELANLTTTATQRMIEDGSPFPVGYAGRWRGRYVFGARRFALTEARRRAARRGVVAHIAAAAREYVITGWLFFRLRPRDALPVAARHLGYLSERMLGSIPWLSAGYGSPAQPNNLRNLARK